MVPDFAVLFCQLTLVFNLFFVMSMPMTTAIHATGRIKWANLINGNLYILVIPITWIAYHYGAAPELPYIVNIISVFTTLFTNMLILKRNMPSFQLKMFVFRVLCLCLLITAIVAGITIFVQHFFIQSFTRLLIVTAISTLTLAICTWTMALPGSMKKILMAKGKEAVGKLGVRKQKNGNTD
jgi:hypothetical protein